MKKVWKAAALCTLLALLAGCAAQSGEEAPALLEPVGVEIDTAVAAYSEIYKIRYYDSAVVPYVEELYLTIDGVVDEMRVIPGQQVQKGDVLLTLNLESVQDQADALESGIEYNKTVYGYQNEQAEMGIEMLRLTLEHLRAAETVDDAAVLAQREAIEDAERSLRQTRETQALEIEILESQLAALQVKLGQNTLYAPFDGTVAYCMDLVEGSYLPAFTTAVFLADDTRPKLNGSYVSLTETRNADRMYAMIGGEEFDVTMIEQDYSQTISDIWAGLTPTTSFSIDGPGDKMDKVRLGDYAALCIVSDYEENALVVPTNAVFRDVSGRYVYVVDAAGNRARTAVETGATNDSITQIVSGLEEGDRVYVKD